MRTWQLSILGAALAAPLLAGGCYEPPPPPSPNSAFPTPVDFRESLSYPPQMVADSAKIALNELDLNPAEETMDHGVGLVTGRLHDGRKIIINVVGRTPSSDALTDVGMTVDQRADPEMVNMVQTHLIAALQRGGQPQAPTPHTDAQIETEHMTK